MLKQLVSEKKELETQIFELIRKFENETGTYISDVNILHNVWQTTNGRKIRTVEVKTEIHI